jgi:hypothetical protein
MVVAAHMRTMSHMNNMNEMRRFSSLSSLSSSPRESFPLVKEKNQRKEPPARVSARHKKIHGDSDSKYQHRCGGYGVGKLHWDIVIEEE